MARARARAALIPDLLVEAQKVAGNVFAGWHGRRKRGIGEDFWQFRPYVPGENMAAIDWRRSARDDHVYVRDREWQAAHMVWLWVDESPSMLFKSQAARVSKQSRSLVVTFALAELLARSGERLGWLGVSRPIISRHAAERLGEALIAMPPQTSFPAGNEVRNYSDVVLVSDFLQPREEIEARMRSMAHRGARGHLVQVVDPAEEDFPYAGRVEFTDPETGERLTAGNAQTLRQGYGALFSSHVEDMRSLARSFGWSHTLHHTDRLASQALASLHIHLTQGRGAR
ncbi:MAG: DUF58 domain-containing protein [Nitratireductor sp.]|nr:DUF58 domain-containing protein [Nitratireductor sp.]